MNTYYSNYFAMDPEMSKKKLLSLGTSYFLFQWKQETYNK
jgi:hypothetical protein